ncbi:Breast cancer type 1 susceptibility [Phytophthora citrophthora]|uniref:Breast cancer type 1 susceptibility n=1 Tax=Phytophthora citrophthora TaxID=4793 RepID=A0AAD9LC87_9STRA|nr:Breast cancer type 1 susceptibility [Phytophthora citrophthora]
MEDTDTAFYRATHGAGAVGPSSTESEGTQEEKQQSRGPVANHKWNIDTQGIRQELKLEQPYLPQNYGHAQGSTAHWKKTSSSDLPDDYGGASSLGNGTSEQRRKNEKKKQKKKKKKVASLDEASEEQKEAEQGSLSSQSNSLMATQEVESYLDRITKQREALSQWERSHQGKSDGEVSLLNLERSLQSSNGFDELIKERRRESQNDGDGDLLTQMTQMTQMPPSTSALESPDLLATFRRRQHDSDSDQRPVKRRVLLSSPPPLHPSGRLSSPSRKRLRMPTPKDNKYPLFGRNNASAIDLSVDSDDDDEVPDSEPATVLPDAEYKSADDQDSDYNDDEDEYEMKPAVPLPPSPEHKPPSPSENSPDRHRERLKCVFSRKKERVSEDFRSAITAFQSGEKQRDSPQSQAAKQLALTSSFPAKKESAASTSEKKRQAASPSPGVSAKPPIHTSSSVKASFRTETGSSFVFVGSDLSREEVKRVLEATQQLGGKFGQDFDLKRDAVSNHFCTSVTHLITRAVPPIGSKPGALPTELRCKRTAKYMRALAEGSFVMDFSWITASLSAGRWLTEEPFEMIGDIYSDAVGKPHEGRLRRAETGRRNSIFNMFCFVLLVSEKEFDFQFASVKALVNNFGGTIIYGDKFSKLNPKQRSRRTPIGVVSKTTLPLDAKAKWQQFRIPIVRITWIFDSVSHLEVLPFDDYYPY